MAQTSTLHRLPRHVLSRKGQSIARRSLAVLIAIFDLPGMLTEWQQRDAQRRHLASLDDRLLADMGITRAQARQEARKLPWQS